MPRLFMVLLVISVITLWADASQGDDNGRDEKSGRKSRDVSDDAAIDVSDNYLVDAPLLRSKRSSGNSTGSDQNSTDTDDTDTGDNNATSTPDPTQVEFIL